jgi:hypothetical protein
VPWEIQRSTLPWREGHHLEFVDLVTLRRDGASLMPKEVGNDQWSIPVNSLTRSQIKAFFTKYSAAN